MSFKTVVVIGGCGGIGLATLQELNENFNIQFLVIIDILEEASAQELLNKSLKTDKFLYFQCPVENISALSEVFQTINSKTSSLDVLINAAGVVDEQNIARTFNINTIGTINSTLLAIEYMRKDKNKDKNGGIIVNIGSVSSYTPTIRTPIYTASKYALLGFTKSLAHPDFFDLTGIKFSLICPGSTRTAISQYVAVQPPLFPELQATYLTFSKNCPRQNAIDVAKCILHAINANENGSVWEVVMGEIKKINA
ncbi:alcohol dehydrogenase-like [Culicoides brevitarsis]|uniref:alcohol dehydrogenase-like n=1 Tax=Culicoides brevitarsis TaxID=469753 RepID=UPI00307CAC98